MKIPNKQGSSDDFQTPEWAIKPLLPFLKRDWTIWECACGKGNLCRAFRKEGFNVVGTDMLYGFDFLTNKPVQCDCIVTNPPYSIKQQFLERAYQLKTPFAFLLPLTTFETAKRQKLFREHGLEVIFFDNRINFETPTGKRSRSWFATAWFTFGLNIGKEMTFTKTKDYNLLPIC